MKILFLLATIIFMSGCANNLLKINLPKSDDPITYPDDTAVDFVTANQVYSRYSVWKTLKPSFKYLMEKKLFTALDKYMSIQYEVKDKDYDWWFRRGILFLDGNSPWRCNLYKISQKDGVATYRLDRYIHIEKSSYGLCDPEFFTVKEIDHHYVVTDIFFMFDPNDKKSFGKKTSINKFFEYAFAVDPKNSKKRRP